MIAPHVLGGADEEAASPETIKKAAGPPATPQESNNSKESTEKLSVWQTSPEPWEEPVDGEELLNELRDTFTRHLILPEHAAPTLALWVLHTQLRAWEHLRISCIAVPGKALWQINRSFACREVLPSSTPGQQCQSSCGVQSH